MKSFIKLIVFVSLFANNINSQTDTAIKTLKEAKDIFFDHKGEPRFEEANLYFSKVIALAPEWDSANYWKGKALGYLHLNDSSIIFLSKAIDLNPNYIEALQYRAFIYERIWEFEKSVNDINTALGIDPKNGENCATRAKLIISQHKYNPKLNLDSLQRLALLEYNKAIEFNPYNKNNFFNRGQLKEQMGDLKSACEDWEKAIVLGYESKEWYCKKCDCKN